MADMAAEMVVRDRDARPLLRFRENGRLDNGEANGIAEDRCRQEFRNKRAQLEAVAKSVGCVCLVGQDTVVPIGSGFVVESCQCDSIGFFMTCAHVAEGFVPENVRNSEERHYDVDVDPGVAARTIHHYAPLEPEFPAQHPQVRICFSLDGVGDMMKVRRVCVYDNSIDMAILRLEPEEAGLDVPPPALTILSGIPPIVVGSVDVALVVFPLGWRETNGMVARIHRTVKHASLGLAVPWWQEGGQLPQDDAHGGTIHHDGSTVHGSSGSPVLVVTPRGDAFVVGLHRAGPWNEENNPERRNSAVWLREDHRQVIRSVVYRYERSGGNGIVPNPAALRSIKKALRLEFRKQRLESGWNEHQQEERGVVGDD